MRFLLSLKTAFENLFIIPPLWKWVSTPLQNDIPLSWDSAQGTQDTLALITRLPELVSTLRGLLDVVRALVPLGVFWAALAAAASAAKFCNCIAFNPAISKTRDQPAGKGASYLLQQWQHTLAEGWFQRGTVLHKPYKQSYRAPKRLRYPSAQ